MAISKWWGVSLGALSGATACGHIPHDRQPVSITNSSSQTNVSDLNADAVAPPQASDGQAGQSLRAPELIYGDETFFRADREPAAPIELNTDTPQGQSFVFRAAPIDAVVHEVLGEGFDLPYSIAPGVSGSISLRLDDIATASDAVQSLNAVLALQNLEIVETSGVFVVSRKGTTSANRDDPIFLAPDDAVPSDASLAVLQIRYANVRDVTDLARAMLPDGVIRHTDDARGFVVLEGEPGEVASAVDLLKSLDVNWLSSVSTALIPVENADASEIAADLAPVIERLGGVSVIPIDRLATLMVVARGHESLNQVTEWVARLDKDAEPTLTEDTLIYEARYVDAGRLASIAGIGGGGSRQSVGTGSRSNSSQTYEDIPTDANFRQRPGGSLYSSIAVQVDTGRNAIIARGEIDELRSLRDLIEALDQPQRQVLIEATIVEVRLDESNRFGIQWNAVEDRVQATFTDQGSNAITSLFPGLSVSYINTDVSMVVNALATTSDAEVVSSPRMLVLNNETARLQIGDQVPVITQTAVSIDDPGAPIVNSTTYRDTGVILSVTPSIRAGGMVEILVSQEVSNVAETTTSNIDSPTISQRAIESRLAVPDGATAVLGGLMSSTRSLSKTGVPILKDIPVAGALFRSTGEVERRTELVILIEPTVVHTVEPDINIPERLREALLRARKAEA